MTNYSNISLCTTESTSSPSNETHMQCKIQTKCVKNLRIQLIFQQRQRIEKKNPTCSHKLENYTYLLNFTKHNTFHSILRLKLNRNKTKNYNQNNNSNVKISRLNVKLTLYLPFWCMLFVNDKSVWVNFIFDCFQFSPKKKKQLQNLHFTRF